jgi:diguanylate cyclase (GGDEF)-like protein/PAS domain S-box-containing protein
MTHLHWQVLIESMLEAVILIDPIQFRIIAANHAATRLLQIPSDELLDQAIVDFTTSPEDLFFWEDVAAGLSEQIHSDTVIQRKDGAILQVTRRVNLVHLDNETTFFILVMHDQSEQRHIENELEKLIAELRATLESTADGILVTDMDGAIRSYNHHFADLWTLPSHLMTERDDAAVFAWMEKCVLNLNDYHRRLGLIQHSPLLEAHDTICLHSGKILDRVTLPQYARGRPIGRVYSFRDITQKLADQARLKLASQVFESSTDAIFITDTEQKIISTNPSFERLTLIKEHTILGLTISEFFSEHSHDEEFALALKKLEANGFWEGELWNRKADGHAYLCMINLVRVQDQDGQTLHYIGFFKDRTEHYTAKQKIEELAFKDVLTGLPNRLLLGERFNQAISHAEREKDPFAVLFLDLDHFKQINDSLGHPFGDKVLIEVTHRLQQCLRQIDTAARLGGDEFVLLLQEADQAGAEICARRIIAELKKPFAIDDINFTVTCSVGIALYPGDGTSMDDLIKNADSAMYHVKERGRSGFRFYQKQMNIGLLSRVKIDHAMRQALEHNQFRLHYQPLIDLTSDTVKGAEALIRWNDKDLGEVSPAKFIPIAEETGLIIAIGNWVMHTAIQQAATWQQTHPHFRISINVSALQFQQTNFVEQVAHALQSANVAAPTIELELTESILIRDVDETLKKLKALSELGVRMSIDDFGTGYSSLSYLKRFPIHKLKIDRSFVMHLPHDESDCAIVASIISLAHALKLKVIAEGVETEEQKNHLQQLHCDELQGFLFSPALSATDFAQRYLA